MLPELEFVPEGEHGYLVEREPVEIALIYTASIDLVFRTDSADRLLDSVILNPAYVPNHFKEGKDYEIRKVRARRIGRTIDILLDQPMRMYETGEDFKMVTFKGTGAIVPSTNQWIIDPFGWYADAGRNCRIWGACKELDAIIEITKLLDEAEEVGVRFTPYIQSNKIPTEVSKGLLEEDDDTILMQPVRLCRTNIMPADLLENDMHIMCPLASYVGGMKRLHSKAKEQFDRLHLANRILTENGLKLAWTIRSQLLPNMYIDGTLKDVENLLIAATDEKFHSITESTSDEQKKYLKQLELYARFM